MSKTVDINLPNYGALRGSVDETRQVVVFKNVPYAIIPERWRAAVKVQPWTGTGVRDATKQGPVCPQTLSRYPLNVIMPEGRRKVGDNPTTQFGLDQDEFNCLNLNIYVPFECVGEQGHSKPVPVMTWIHGGGFREGSNGDPLYDASNIVKRSIEVNQPVIVVCMNYRLNSFGFLASKEMEQEIQEQAASASEAVSEYNQLIGNWGLMDQKLAFEWVRENIHAFGGQANNITAFGESAGSISIHYHMLCPSHFGLFDRAIMHSGTVATLPAVDVFTDGQMIFDRLLNNLDIPLDLDGPEKMRRLRAIPFDTLAAAGGNRTTFPGFQPYYAPNRKDTFLPAKIPIQVLCQDPHAYDPNLQAVFIGVNKDEGTAFAISSHGPCNLKTWSSLFQKLVPDMDLIPLFESDFRTMLPPKTDSDVFQLVSKLTGDHMMQYPVYKAAETLLALQRQKPDRFRVDRYHFDAEIQKMNELAPGMGALHVAEVPYVFQPPALEMVLSEDELILSRAMQDLWIAFAHHLPLSVEGRMADTDEAIIFTKDYHIQIGEGVRLSKDALMFWSRSGERAVEACQAQLLRREY
ncbi:hypothetical protein BGZ83_005708 [Gryganskiella cystojenkinii]|nr:hypothetical protein BGZ83_005708 [Gryganskiella cystojenkinii]